MDAAEAPLLLLLLQVEGVEGCPGCRLEAKKIQSKGAPKKELFFVALLVLCNSLPISSLFPFIYFMVRDFHVAKTDKDIGYYAGYLGSSLMVGRFLTSTLWGFLADKYGRKPVFIIGTASIVLFNTMFGFSTQYWMALLSRFLLGLFNGMLGPVRAYASEICSAEHQALGMSLVGTLWGLGLIIGPALGGYLAQPASKYPKLFADGSLFDRFPYALPCVCISAFAVLTLIISFWLPESLHNHPLPNPYNICKDTKVDSGVFQKHGSKTSGVSAEHRTNIQETKQAANDKSLLRNWGLIAAISVYCLWGLHDMAYSEVFSLWAVSPVEYGGLGFSTSDVGIVLAVTGAMLLLFQIFLFPPLAKTFGAILVIQAPAVLTIPLVAVFPIISSLSGIAIWGTLIFASTLKNVLSICVVTGSFLLINNSVTMDQRGVANGTSMAFLSLFKAAGPTCAGALFSWSQKRNDAAFLPGNWMVFFVIDIMCVITIIFTFQPFLPKSLNNPKLEIYTQVDNKDQHLERAASFTF